MVSFFGHFGRGGVFRCLEPLLPLVVAILAYGEWQEERKHDGKNGIENCIVGLDADFVGDRSRFVTGGTTNFLGYTGPAGSVGLS